MSSLNYDAPRAQFCLDGVDGSATMLPREELPSVRQMIAIFFSLEDARVVLPRQNGPRLLHHGRQMSALWKVSLGCERIKRLLQNSVRQDERQVVELFRRPTLGEKGPPGNLVRAAAKVSELSNHAPLPSDVVHDGGVRNHHSQRIA